MKFIYLVFTLVSTISLPFAKADVAVSQSTENSDWYLATINGEDLVTFRAAFSETAIGATAPAFKISFSRPIAIDVVTFSDQPNALSATLAMNANAEFLALPGSPMQRYVSPSSGADYLSLLIDSRMNNSLPALYDAISIEPKQAGAKYFKTWKSSDGRLIVSCQANTMPIVSTHGCNFKMRIGSVQTAK